jgi:hypothetical protein
MPANNMDLQAYANFLTACANDPRFNCRTLAAIRKENPKIGWVDRLIYKLFVVGATKKGISSARDNLVRQASAVWPGPRRHVQSLQSPAEDAR